MNLATPRTTLAEAMDRIHDAYKKINVDAGMKQ